jgi:hypothetical protein
MPATKVGALLSRSTLGKRWMGLGSLTHASGAQRKRANMIEYRRGNTRAIHECRGKGSTAVVSAMHPRAGRRSGTICDTFEGVRRSGMLGQTLG